MSLNKSFQTISGGRVCNSKRLRLGQVYTDWRNNVSVVLSREEDKVDTQDGTMYVYTIRPATADEIRTQVANVAQEKARRAALTTEEVIAEDMARVKTIMPGLDWGG